MISNSDSGEVMAALLSASLKSRNCPVCSTTAVSGLRFLDRRIDKDRITSFSFASRKVPEYMNYKLLRCPHCDVVYACESPKGSEISDAYHEAAYDSKEEAIHAAEAYEKALQPVLVSMIDRCGALDIGTGTGVFLSRMRSYGFTAVAGVEPSRAAIEAADADIKPCIREGMFSGADFEPGSFALITCFMTLEHVSDPGNILRDCSYLLKPGGVIAVVVHDWRALNNRLLGRNSPIIDIEHLQLFSRKSIKNLLARSGFVGIECKSFWNSYQIIYWNRLAPVPLFLKKAIECFLRKTGIGYFRLSINVGNLMVVARKSNNK